MVADMDWMYESPQEKYDSFRNKIERSNKLVAERFDEYELYQTPESAYMQYARTGQMAADLEDGYAPLSLEDFREAFAHDEAIEKDRWDEDEILDLEDRFQKAF